MKKSKIECYTLVLLLKKSKNLNKSVINKKFNLTVATLERKLSL